MRLVCAITFLAGILLTGSTLARSVELVSRTAAGNPGQADSGSIRGGSEMRPASVLDDGSVYFVSLAQLTSADSNVLTDYYWAAANGTMTAVDLPTGIANGHFFWGDTDADGGKFYLIRQFPDPSQFELRFGGLANKTLLAVRANITAAAFAGDGTYAVYERIVSGYRHLFLQDLTSTAITEIQLTEGSNGDSRSPAISRDGARIVFSSTGSNVVADDNNGVADVFLYERASGDFTLISQRFDNFANSAALSPDISGNGQVICFTSADHGFVPGDTNASSDVFVYQAGTMQRCSVASDGTQANADSRSPRLNANGRFVVFISTASNLGPDLSNGFSQVFLFDRDLAQLEVISRNADGTPADADCFEPEISPGGRYVTFVSKARNLSPGVEGAYYQIYRVDRGSQYANHPPTAQNLALTAPQGTSIPFILTATDADQDEIKFIIQVQPAHGRLTDANGTVLTLSQEYDAAGFPWYFVPADGSVFSDSFSFRVTDGKTVSALASVSIRMLDPNFGAISRLSIASAGTEGTSDSFLPYPGLDISADGSLVVFSSTASELDPADADNGLADIFLRDTVADSTRLLTPGGSQNKKSYRCVLSGDGRTTAYYSEEGNGLILQDLFSGVRTTVVNVSSYLNNSGLGISDDGMRVLYEKDGQIWLFDRALGTTQPVSLNTAGETANANCADSALSADGRSVVFSSSATNLDPANPNAVRSLYLRLPDEGLTRLIPTSQSGQALPNSIKPALSETGRYLIFLADAVGTLYRKDLAGGELQQLAVNAANPSISADGRFVCYTKVGENGKKQLYRADLAAATRTVQLVSNAMGQEGDGDSYRGALSATGRFVAFASNAENLVPDDSNAKCDVFLNDFGIPLNELPIPSLSSITIDVDMQLRGVPLTYIDTEDNDVRTEIVSRPAHAARFDLHSRRPFEKFATFSYTPAANYQGEDSFSYRCADAEGWSAPQTVTITILALLRWTDMPVLWVMRPEQEFRLDLSRYVADPDTSNPDPDNFLFSLLQGSSSSARIESTVLIISAEGTAGSEPLFLRIGVARGQAGTVVEFAEELALHVREPLEILLHAGWNLLSLPMLSEPTATALLQTKTISAAAGEWRPLGPVWHCDVETAVYHRVATIEPGRAYWVFCPESVSLTMQVAWEAPVDPTIALVPGWNLVGPVGFAEFAIPTWSVTGSPIASENVWGWDGAKWEKPSHNILGRGRGYFFYSHAAQNADLLLEFAE